MQHPTQPPFISDDILDMRRESWENFLHSRLNDVWLKETFEMFESVIKRSGNPIPENPPNFVVIGRPEKEKYYTFHDEYHPCENKIVRKYEKNILEIVGILFEVGECLPQPQLPDKQPNLDKSQRRVRFHFPLA